MGRLSLRSVVDPAGVTKGGLGLSNVAGNIKKLEDSVFRSDLVKTLDPLGAAVYSDVQRNLARLGTLLTPNMPVYDNLGGTQARSDEAIAADAKKQRLDAKGRRQGAGVGATLLTDDDTQQLEKSTLLGL